VVANFPGANVAVPGAYGTCKYVDARHCGHDPVKYVDTPDHIDEKYLVLTYSDGKLACHKGFCRNCGIELHIYDVGSKEYPGGGIEQLVSWNYRLNTYSKPLHCDALRMESAIG